MGVKSVRSVSLGIVCGGVGCLTILVLGTATVRVTDDAQRLDCCFEVG